ncbi:MAG: hypothetical protein COY86_08440, partial [Rhodobacterales bacterium CG_4_10_14_0_8_um_filter_70_9]
HLCCGSAGTYNLMQPKISQQLIHLKIENIMAVSPQIIAAGNIGCIVQIASTKRAPVVHTVELLDWATGGPKPRKLEGLDFGGPPIGGRHAQGDIDAGTGADRCADRDSGRR